MGIDRLALVALVLAACSCGGSGESDTSTESNEGGGQTTLGTDASAGGMGGNAPISTGSGGADALVLYGPAYEGGLYHLGPVDYDETEWHNACAPSTKYASQVRVAEGTFLAGLWGGIPDVASYCDACIWVTTKAGKSAILRVVTYGDTSTNSIDVSPDAYDALSVGEDPRDMTWQFARCPESGAMMYEFQTGASEWWTSLWVRNARVPLTKVEVKSTNHGDWVELERGGDGTLTDNSGFGAGAFSIRSTGVDGAEVVENFDWPSSGIAGAFLVGEANFD